LEPEKAGAGPNPEQIRLHFKRFARHRRVDQPLQINPAASDGK